MFVITADQRDSRHDHDRVDQAIASVISDGRTPFVLPPERTAGDEFQCVLDRADAVVPLVLDLHRTGHWSIGLGIGPVDRPLPATTRAATGEAYFAARRAVEASKGRPTRFSLDPDAPGTAAPAPADVQALIDPLLQIVDLLESGLSQKDAAERLAVSPQAVSLRVRAASARVDAPARDALARLLTVVDRTLGPTDERTPR
jgi:hypothetical protein